MSLFDPAPDSPATLPQPTLPPWQRRNPTAWRVMVGEKHLGTVPVRCAAERRHRDRGAEP